MFELTVPNLYTDSSQIAKKPLIVKFQVQYFQKLHFAVADLGFPGGGGAKSPGGGANIRFCHIFPKTAWNWKNLDRERSLAPPLDPPMFCFYQLWQFWQICLSLKPDFVIFVGAEVERYRLPDWLFRHHGGRGAPGGAARNGRLLRRDRLLRLPLNTGNSSLPGPSDIFNYHWMSSSVSQNVTVLMNRVKRSKDKQHGVTHQ